MVSIFPDLLNYGFPATGVLRITLGIILVHFAYSKIFHRRAEHVAFFEKMKMHPAVFFFAIVSGAELMAGIGLLIGFYTQLAALVTGTLMSIATLIKWRRPSLFPENTIEFYIIFAIASFALMFMGPGALAFDWAL